MKKRFTLMMMVLCILMSIPLKMMAYDEVTVVSHYKQNGDWGPNSNFNFTTTDGKIYTCTLDNVPSGTQAIWFRIVKGGKQYGPGADSKSDLLLTGTYQKIFEGTNNALKIVPTSGKTSYTITYDYVNNQIKYDKPEGGTTGGGSTDPTEKWDTETVNRLKGRVYSQGFYLAGNFFSFQPKENVDHGDLITYDDAVFKFQQQKNDATIESGKNYEVYKVEIPASLTAHAQVMYVDEFGKTKISLAQVVLLVSVKLAQKQMGLKGGWILRLMIVILLLKRIPIIGFLPVVMKPKMNILMVCIICISLSMLRLMKLRSGRLCMIVTSV